MGTETMVEVDAVSVETTLRLNNVNVVSEQEKQQDAVWNSASLPREGGVEKSDDVVEVNDSLKREVNDSLDDSLEIEVNESLKTEVNEPLKTEVKDSLNSEVKDSLNSEVKDSLISEVKDSLNSEVNDSLNSEVSDSLESEATMEEVSLLDDSETEAAKGTPLLNTNEAEGKLDAFSPARSERELEVQGVEASELPITPPTPERSSAVIRLTRQMSRVSSGMGPMSPKFEIRASKELQELQEKVRLLEEEIKLRREECAQLTLSFKEKESQLVYKIECLELANEQLLQGGHDSSIQLQMELTRLQRQNSVLSVRERELQFQINTQEMLNAQMLEKRPITDEVPSVSKLLESKITVLESKLAEAVEVTNMYKIQLRESVSKLEGAQSDALSKGGEGEDAFMELQKLRKLSKDQETEIQDLQDRYFLVSVRLAESDAQREELLMKIKRITFKKC